MIKKYIQNIEKLVPVKLKSTGRTPMSLLLANISTAFESFLGQLAPYHRVLDCVVQLDCAARPTRCPVPSTSTSLISVSFLT